ncbi:MAG: XdhC family protein [Gammaproteobacteria bacterium]|nr:XdhC family protein [Gammaproteobacteria bacterium]
MQDSQLDVLQGCAQCLKQGHKISLVSVAKTWGTSPRPEGSLLAVSDHGHFFGSVSGGCVEEDLIQKLTKQPACKPQLIMYGETQEQRHHFGLPCGGVLQLVVEPFNNLDEVESLIASLKKRETLYRCVTLNQNDVKITPWQLQNNIELEGNIWKNIFGPTWRLVIIGAGETGQFLAQMAQGLGYDVLVSDPRPDYRRNWPHTSITLLEGFPDDILDSMHIDQRTAIVTVAHDPKVDDMALLSALNSDAFYVGSLGSQQTNHERRQRLVEHFGFNHQQVDRLHGPVGIYIGSKTPAEIALSILAQITAIKNGVAYTDTFTTSSKTAACSIR